MDRFGCLSIILCAWNFILQKGSLAMTTNAAVRKSTMQSTSLGPNIFSHLAADGNSRQALPGGGIAGLCTHTGSNSNEWWIVNLGAIFDIYNIIIYGRSDCCADRLQDFDVDVITPVRLHDNLTMSTIDTGRVIFRHYVGSPTTYIDLECPNNTHGQFVRIRHRRNRVLTLCEVIVLGKHATCLKASDVSRHDMVTDIPVRQLYPSLSIVQFIVWPYARLLIAVMQQIST